MIGLSFASVRRHGIVLVAAGVAAIGLTVGTASAGVPVKYSNCMALNAKYPHGVGLVGARQKTTGEPVTAFKRSNALYRLNVGRDRDKDGIACEKK